LAALLSQDREVLNVDLFAHCGCLPLRSCRGELSHIALLLVSGLPSAKESIGIPLSLLSFFLDRQSMADGSQEAALQLSRILV